VTPAIATRPSSGRLQCRCDTKLAVKIVVRSMGRSKSYKARCAGCGKESGSTFYADRVDARWNEVAAK